VSVAAAVLAAGLGTRFAAGPKPLATLRGRPLVAFALEAAVTSGLRPVLLVTSDAAIAQCASDPVSVVPSPDAARGIAHSLRAAIGALDARADVSAVCIGLADQPRVGADAYVRLADAHTVGAQLAVATYDGRRANPVLIGRDLWPAARELVGDVGARALMEDHEVTEVDCTGTGDPRDVDTLDDLRALEEEMA
jgi:CTP:molybdopterin cytidylyltransferase MocA